MDKSSYINKTIHVCPVEGIVSKEETHTHRHEIFVVRDSVKIITTIYFYMSNQIDISVLETTKQELSAQMELQANIINDYDPSLLETFPDHFIETIVYVMNRSTLTEKP